MVGSVAALDLVPAAYLVVPEGSWKTVALVWMMAAVAAGGTFATLAASKLPRPDAARSGQRPCPDDAARSGQRRCPDDAARLRGAAGGASSNGEGAVEAAAAAPLEEGSSPA